MGPAVLPALALKKLLLDTCSPARKAVINGQRELSEFFNAKLPSPLHQAWLKFTHW
jgi:hypothetical protein